MFSGEVSIPQEIMAGVEESRNVYNSLSDFPLWMRISGVGFSQASRTMRIYRELENIENEFNSPVTSKFKDYLNILKAPVIGFHKGFTGQLSEGNKQIAVATAGQITKDLFEYGNRQATLRRAMARNQVPVSQLRQISDGEVRRIRTTVPTTLRNAFDNYENARESQLLNLALYLSSDS